MIQKTKFAFFFPFIFLSVLGSEHISIDDSFSSPSLTPKTFLPTPPIPQEETTDQTCSPLIKNPKILSLDGGGSRGAMMCFYLCWLTRYTGKPIHDLFNLIAASSTGAIMAAAFGTKKIHESEKLIFKDIPQEGHPLSILHQDPPASPYYTPDDLLMVYKESSSVIFRNSNIFNEWARIYPYSSDPLEDLINKYFYYDENKEPLTLSKLEINTLLTTYNFNDGKIVLYSTHEALKEKEKNIPVCNIVRAAVAAPTYFTPTNQLNPGKAMGDAGIVLNNPAQFARLEAAKLYGVPLHHCVIFSLGSGKFLNEYKTEELINFNNKDVLYNIVLNRAFDGNMIHQMMKGTYTFHYKEKTKDWYFRVSPSLPESLYKTDSSDKSFFDGLQEIAIKDLTENIDKFKHIADILKRDE